MIEMLLAGDLKLEGQGEKTLAKAKKGSEDELAFWNMVVEYLGEMPLEEGLPEQESPFVIQEQPYIFKQQDDLAGDVPLEVSFERLDPKHLSLLQKLTQEVNSEETVSSEDIPGGLVTEVVPGSPETREIPIEADAVGLETKEEPVVDGMKMQQVTKEIPVMDGTKVQQVEEIPVMDGMKVQQVEEIPVVDGMKMQQTEEIPIVSSVKVQQAAKEEITKNTDFKQPEKEPKDLIRTEVKSEAPKEELPSRLERVESSEEMVKNDGPKEKPLEIPVEKVDTPKVGPVSVERTAPGNASVKEPLQLDFDKQTWVEDLKQTYGEMVKKAHYKGDNGQYQMKLQLKPEYLGKMEILVEMKNGVIQTKFIVENEQVKQLLTNQMQEFRTDNPIQIQVREPLSFNSELFDRHEREGYEGQEKTRDSKGDMVEVKSEEIVVTGLDILA